MTDIKSAESWDSEMVSLSEKFSSIEIIQQIQRNAIEAALELAAAKAKICVDYQPLGMNTASIDKKSITSLTNHPKLKV